jgi:hypothetical protein
MALFEQRFSGEQVAAARRAIAAGSSLRAAAAAIGCAPSTLSVRIKQAEAAEADALFRLGGGARQPPLRARGRGAAKPTAAELEPVEVLRGALQATKANGQPDWQIRLSAARALEALDREQGEPEPLSDPDYALIVYDLPPDSSPILHAPMPPQLSGANEYEPAQPLPEAGTYFFQPPTGDLMLLVRHANDESKGVHLLDDYEAAAELLDAVGGDRRILGTHPADAGLAELVEGVKALDRSGASDDAVAAWLERRTSTFGESGQALALARALTTADAYSALRTTPTWNAATTWYHVTTPAGPSGAFGDPDARTYSVGDTINLPNSSQPPYTSEDGRKTVWRVAAVESDDEPGFTARLVVEPVKPLEPRE